MKRTKRHLVPSLLAWALAIGASAPALAAGGADPVKARQEAMEGVGRAMKSLSAIAKKEAPFDAAVVKKNADRIAENLKKAAALFPAGSEKGSVPSEAKPEIWSDAAGFSSAMVSAHTAAEGLQKVDAEAAFLPALKQLGGTCKECHDMYRVPKKR